MMIRTQITLETELQRLARDLARLEASADVSKIFDLGSSGGSNIAKDKDSMIANAFDSMRKADRR